MSTIKRSQSGFTLIELLVVLLITGLLAGLLLPGIVKAGAKAKQVQCINQLRQIGLATTMYADDNAGMIPRSTHSATAYGQLPWAYALAPYITGSALAPGDIQWPNLFNGLYRCPVDRRRNNNWSYGKNVYPELSAAETGGPTWPTLNSIPNPTGTVLFAEKLGGSMADHFMAHFWPDGGEPEVDRSRHGPTSNYCFCDGHIANQKFELTYDAGHGINRWNPDTAR